MFNYLRFKLSTGNKKNKSKLLFYIKITAQSMKQCSGKRKCIKLKSNLIK